MSYGPSLLYTSACGHLWDKILKRQARRSARGAAMKFDLVINLKTPSPRLTIPQTLLFQADEVISRYG